MHAIIVLIIDILRKIGDMWTKSTAERLWSLCLRKSGRRHSKLKRIGGSLSLKCSEPVRGSRQPWNAPQSVGHVLKSVYFRLVMIYIFNWCNLFSFVSNAFHFLVLFGNQISSFNIIQWNNGTSCTTVIGQFKYCLTYQRLELWGLYHNKKKNM